LKSQQFSPPKQENKTKQSLKSTYFKVFFKLLPTGFLLIIKSYIDTYVVPLKLGKITGMPVKYFTFMILKLVAICFFQQHGLAFHSLKPWQHWT